MNRFTIGCFAVALLAACGGDEATENNNTNCGPSERCVDPTDTGPNGSDDTGGTEADMGSPNAMTTDMSSPNAMTTDTGPTDMGTPTTSCNRMPAAADRDRKVVVALPFTETQWEVLDLSMTGELTRPGVTFAMGRGFDGEIQFTPDGELGYAVQDDGSIGVFRFNSSGMPEVLAANHDPGFYVSGATMGPRGDFLYAWETGFREINGEIHGAIYRLPLDCATGIPGDFKDVFAPAKLPKGVEFLSDGRVAVAATDLLDDETPNDVHLMDLAGPTRVASAPAFSSMDPITSGFAVTANGRHAILGNTSLFETNTVATVAIDGDTLTPSQIFEIGDPIQIVTSPFDNAAIVLSAQEDELNILGYDPDAVEPFTDLGPLDVAEPSLLPGSATMVERGSLEGLVLIAENVSIRRVQFDANGTVTDLGLTGLGMGVEAIPGAIGLQP